MTHYPTAHQAATIDALMDQTGLGPLYATDLAFRDMVDHIAIRLAPAMIRACADTIPGQRLAQGFAAPLQDRRSS
jgi:hypothetical protein